MPRALKDILGELRELITGDYTLDSMATDLASRENGWPELHQQVFNAGHKKATAQGGEDVRSLERKLDEAQQREDTLKKQVKKLEEKTPDSAALRQEYENREATLKQQYETRIGELQTKVTTGYRLTRAQKLAKELANEENMLYPEYASEISETKYADRFTEDEKGNPVVLQLGQKIPYSAQSEDEAIKLLAKDIRKATPAFGIRSGTERGGGNRNDGPGGGGNKTTSDEAIRSRKALSGDYVL